VTRRETEMAIRVVRCPDCGSSLVGQHLLVEGNALVDGWNAETGKLEFHGYTAIIWDSERDLVNPAGQLKMLCERGHNFYFDPAAHVAAEDATAATRWNDRIWPDY
jgi:hypothetical protein